MIDTAGRTKQAALISNILVIIGFIILILFMIWGLFQLAVLSKSWLSSLSGRLRASQLAIGSPYDTSEGTAATTEGTVATTNNPGTKNAEKPAVNVDAAPDLSVRILSAGVIDRTSGEIVPRRNTSGDDLVAVRFDIANYGATSTGPWYFTALLPTLPPYRYTSSLQSPLAPGGHIENVLRFTQADPNGVFSVSVDPGDLVRESDRGNNTAGQAL